MYECKERVNNGLKIEKKHLNSIGDIIKWIWKWIYGIGGEVNKERHK